MSATNKKNKFITVIEKHKLGSLIVLILLILGICIPIVVSKKSFSKKTISQEEQLTEYLKELGKDFYENVYYQQIGQDEESRKVFLTKLKHDGIKLTLNSLSTHKIEENKDKIESFVNNETKKACNKENTKVIVYPQAPYGQTDYKIEITLDCGF